MKIYLIGFMGSGKTFYARKMSEKMNLPFFDLDSEIEKKVNLQIENIFSHYGENYFRDLESQILINSSFEGIIATGGGIIERDVNRQYLKKQITIWINPDWKTLYGRIKNSNRPLVKKLSEHELYLLWEKRRQLYEKCASYIITDDFEANLVNIFKIKFN